MTPSVEILPRLALPPLERLLVPIGWTIILTLALAGLSPVRGDPVHQATARKVTFELEPGQVLEALVETGRWEILDVDGTTVTALEQISEEATRTPIIPLERRIVTQEFRVLSADIDEELAAFREQGHEGDYHTPEEGEAALKAHAASHPEICHIESIGKTAHDRDIWAVRLGSNSDDPDLPRVLIFGLVHAREWISMEVPFDFIDKAVAGYGTDERITRMLDERVLWVIPITNPDGLNYSQTEYKMWRKNRNKVSRWGTGVDVNRNFEVGFGRGSSGMPYSDVYRGPHAGSEAETQALLGLMEREGFHVSLSFHSYSEIILYPFGYTRNDPPHADVYKAHGEAMKAFNGYRHGSVAQILYTAGGATDDTFFTKYGCWSFTFELARQFVPPEDEIAEICAENLPAVFHLVEAAQELMENRPDIGPQTDPARTRAYLERLHDAARAGSEEAAETLEELLPVVLDREGHDIGDLRRSLIH